MEAARHAELGTRAVLLAAEAALRSGAGLVGVATRAAHVPAMLARCPEVMARAVDGAAALRPLLERAGIVAIGPGLGQAAWGSALFGVALAAGKPLVLDADGLNLLAKGGGGQRLPADAILTPHPGEAARLLDCSVADIEQDRISAVRRLHEQFGGVIVLKGAGTLIFDGACLVIANVGNAGLARGGTGDILTGLIGGLLAQKVPPFMAAQLAVCLHGDAADLAVRETGVRGMLATDLIPHIRELLAK